MKADFADRPFTCMVAIGDSITMGAAASELIATHCSCLSRKSFREAEAYPRWADERESVLRTYSGLLAGAVHPGGRM